KPVGGAPGQQLRMAAISRLREVTVDPDQTTGYAFAADGKTFRTVYREYARTGGFSKLEVREVSAETGRTLRTTTTVEVNLAGYGLSPDGKWLAVSDRAEMITMYDADRGTMLWTLPAKLQPELAPIDRDRRGGFGFGFSPDGRKVVVIGRVARPYVL